MSSKSPLLNLPQELRDLIFAHAVSETLPWPTEIKESEREAIDPSAPSHVHREICAGHNQRRISYPTDPPRPTWYSLLRCCRQTNIDLQGYWVTAASRSHRIGEASATPPTLDLTLRPSQSTSTVSWSTLPYSPTTAKTLKIDVALSNIWDPDLQSTKPTKDNQILAAVFDILKRYTTNGPYFLRSSPLEKPLNLDTLIVEVSPESSSNGMSCFRGEPGLQLADVYRVLLTWVGRMCRSGVLWSKVGRVVLRAQTNEEEWDEKMICVTNNVSDEKDFMIMGGLGYAW